MKRKKDNKPYITFAKEVKESFLLEVLLASGELMEYPNYGWPGAYLIFLETAKKYQIEIPGIYYPGVVEIIL